MGNDRYARQLLIDKWDQSKLGKTVTIAGLGALGSVVATSLAMAGVQHLLLVDYDTVEVSNLNRQLIFQSNDVGKFKAVVAAERLRQFNPEIQIEAFNQPIEQISRDILLTSDVIVEGLDNFQSRRWINSFAVSSKIPLVSGGMYGFFGNIQVIIPYQTPCLDCQTLIPEEELQKACTPFGKKRKAERPENDETEVIPSVSSVSFVIGGLMAQEAFKILLDLPPLSTYLFWDGQASVFTEVSLARRDDCFICSSQYQLESLPIRFPATQSMQEFAQQMRYSFNLSTESIFLKKTSVIPISSEKIGNIVQNGDIIRIIDSVLTTPLKIKVLLD